MGIKEIHISKFKPSLKLAEDIYSSLGGILYRKGTTLKEKDNEILKAFGVLKFKIEEGKLINKIEERDNKECQSTDDEEKPNEAQHDKKITLFQREFHQGTVTIDKLLKAARGKTDVSILELREAIQPLIDKLNTDPKQLLTINSSLFKLEQYQSYHSLFVGLMSYLLAKWLELDKNEWMPIALAGVLHDIGMSRVPDQITFNKGKLNHYELAEIKKHPVYGYEILKETIGLNKGTLLAVLQHHEREDGSGYPLKLKKEQIHNYAKIIAIADVFHAMISRRTYRSGYTIFNTLEHLLREGYQKLDMKYVHILVQKISQFTLSEKVRLNDGRQGVVMFIDQHYPTKPWVKVGNDIINLINEKTIFIKEIEII